MSVLSVAEALTGLNSFRVVVLLISLSFHVVRPRLPVKYIICSILLFKNPSRS